MFILNLIMKKQEKSRLRNILQNNGLGFFKVLTKTIQMHPNSSRLKKMSKI